MKFGVIPKSAVQVVKQKTQIKLSMDDKSNILTAFVFP